MVRRIIGIAMMVLPFLMFIFIVRLWPIGKSSGNADQTTPTWDGVWKCASCDSLPFEPRMIIIVLLAGALGGTVHTATSYASYVGSRKFVDSWGWWYFLRIPIGMGLALILYFALRGGFFTPLSGNGVTAESVINPFGFAAIAALAGMFSKQATDKLKELFDGLFRTQEDAGRADKLTTDKPSITKIEPTDIPAGTKSADLVISGNHFDPEARVMIDGKVRPADRTSNSAMALSLKAKDLSAPATLEVVVANPSERGGESEAFTVTVK